MKYQGILAIMYKDIGGLENLSLCQKLNSFATWVNKIEWLSTRDVNVYRKHG